MGIKSKIKSLDKSDLDKKLLLCIFIIVFLISVLLTQRVISDKAWSYKNEKSFMLSDKYTDQLNSINYSINTNFYDAYYNGGSKPISKEDFDSVSFKDTVNSSLTNYAPGIFYFIIDHNNNDAVYKNTDVKNEKEFFKRYENHNFTTVQTNNDETSCYVLGKRNYDIRAYDFAGDYGGDEYEIDKKVKPPTVLFAVNEKLPSTATLEKRYNENTSLDIPGIYGLKMDYYGSLKNILLINIACIIISIVIAFKLISKYGVKGIWEIFKGLLCNIGYIFNHLYIEFRVFVLFVMILNLSEPSDLNKFDIGLLCFFLLSMYEGYRYDAKGMFKCSGLTKVKELIYKYDVTKSFSKQAKRRMLMQITRCVVWGGVCILSTFTYEFFGDGLSTFLGLFSMFCLIINIIKLYHYSLKSVRDIEDIYNYTVSLGNGYIDAKLYLGKNSQYKEMEINLNRLNDHIREVVNNQVKSEKMKGELITNVSHDLKTPLTSLITYIDILKNGNNTDEEIKEYIDILDNKANKLKTLVEDVVEISKANSGNITLNKMDINLKNMVSQCASEFDAPSDLEIPNIKINCEEEDVFVYTDGEKLWRIMQNLIQNAIKYSLSGTRIYIDINKFPKEIIVSNTANYEMNFEKEEVLTRFYRSDKARDLEGFGLGLSIVQSFSSAMDIDFDIEVEKDMFKAILKFK